MRLTLTITSGPEGLGAAETKQIGRDPFSIGRAADNNWVLADPERHLSKRHCRISFRDTFWELTDLSTNGTFLNRELIGNRGVRDLRDGDRLRLGGYEIAVALGQDLPASRLTDASRMVDSFSLTGFPAPLHGPVSDFCRRPASPPDAEPLDGPVQPDHTPGVEEAFSPPRPVVLLDDDWDLGGTPEAPPAPQSNLLPELSPDLPPAMTPEIPLPGGRDEDLMAAFLRGAGMADARPANPVAAMEALGAAFRALVGGLRETLMARAAVKSEFRIEQTMIRARGNNPLKFSASDDDALLALVGTGRRTDIGPAEAVAEAFHDIRLHELATMAAMQTAVRDLLRELAPVKLREQTDQAGGLGLLPSQRKVRAWDAFEATHGRLTQALSDNFDSAFGRAFSRAYEQASRESGRDGAGR